MRPTLHIPKPEGGTQGVRQDNDGSWPPLPVRLKCGSLRLLPYQGTIPMWKASSLSGGWVKIAVSGYSSVKHPWARLKENDFLLGKLFPNGLFLVTENEQHHCTWQTSIEEIRLCGSTPIPNKVL